MTALFSSKCVLHITDENLYAYKVSGKNVTLIGVFDWMDEDLIDGLIECIRRDAGGASVIMINDTVDQHYRRERVPRVGIMDSVNVIKRKLALAFPNYAYRAFIKLGENSSQSTEVKGDNYLFAACPDTTQIQKIIDAIRDSDAPIGGFGLLPVEAVSFVDTLCAKVQGRKAPSSMGGFNINFQLTASSAPKKKKQKGPKQWTIFIGQNKSGGLRQIVTKDGELALTRITPIVESDSDVNLWVHDIVREYRATMTYLSRFGYTPADQLNLIVIANPKSEETLVKALSGENTKLHILTLSQAGSYIGISTDPDTDQRIADPLHVGWVAKKPKMVMPITGSSLDSVLIPRRNAVMAMMALTVALVGSVYYAGTSYIEYNKVQQDIAAAQAELSQVTNIYDSEIERKEALGIDIKLIQNSLFIAEDMDQKDVQIFSLLKNIRRAQGGLLRLDEISIDRPAEKDNANSVYQDPAANYVDPNDPNYLTEDTARSIITLKLSFPSTANVIQGNAAVESLSRRLEKVLPKDKVEVTKILKDVSYRGEIKSDLSDTAAGNKSDTRLEAEIRILQRPVQTNMVTPI